MLHVLWELESIHFPWSVTWMKHQRFVTWSNQYILRKKVRGSVWFVIQGVEKTFDGFVLSVTADGQMLPPMIIFKGNTEQTIRDLNIPTDFIVKTWKKAWMDDDLTVWIEGIWLKHTQAECERIGFENSLLSFDVFAAHLSDGVKAQLLESNSDIPDILPIPAGCTSKCQPMDVRYKKPFKAIMRRCWRFSRWKYWYQFETPSTNRSTNDRWVKEGFEYLVQDHKMVKKSLQVCGNSSSDPDKMRNDAFF